MNKLIRNFTTRAFIYQQHKGSICVDPIGSSETKHFFDMLYLTKNANKLNQLNEQPYTQFEKQFVMTIGKLGKLNSNDSKELDKIKKLLLVVNRESTTNLNVITNLTDNNFNVNQSVNSQKVFSSLCNLSENVFDMKLILAHFLDLMNLDVANHYVNGEYKFYSNDITNCYKLLIHPLNKIYSKRELVKPTFEHRLLNLTTLNQLTMTHDYKKNKQKVLKLQAQLQTNPNNKNMLICSYLISKLKERFSVSADLSENLKKNHPVFFKLTELIEQNLMLSANYTFTTNDKFIQSHYKIFSYENEFNFLYIFMTSLLHAQQIETNNKNITEHLFLIEEYLKDLFRLHKNIFLELNQVNNSLDEYIKSRTLLRIYDNSNNAHKFVGIYCPFEQQ